MLYTTDRAFQSPREFVSQEEHHARKVSRNRFTREPYRGLSSDTTIRCAGYVEASSERNTRARSPRRLRVQIKSAAHARHGEMPYLTRQ